jgi:hypothetical protein
MSLTNHARLARFEARRPTPSSCRGLNTDGERLYSYGLELARHGIMSGKIRCCLKRIRRDRVYSSHTTRRHWWLSRSSMEQVDVAPQQYERLTARFRDGDAPLLLPARCESHFERDMAAHDELLWQLWLAKLEQDHGKVARKYAARRLPRFRKRMQFKQFINAL